MSDEVFSNDESLAGEMAAERVADIATGAAELGTAAALDEED